MSSSQSGLHRNYIQRKLVQEPGFRGVVSRQEFCQTVGPSLGPRQSVIILHHHHYTCLSLSADRKTCFYFDPLGILSLSNEVAKMLQSVCAHTVFYNKKSVQTAQSDKCGLFCMYFVVKNVYSPTQFQTFLDVFTPACHNNDHLVYLLLNRKI